MDSIGQKGEMGVHHFKAVQACKKVSMHLQHLKDSTEQIFQAQSEPHLLQNYTIQVNSIIWSTPKLNLLAVKEFNRMIVEQFGIDYVKQAHHGINVDQSLISLVSYNGVQEFEKAAYLENFLNRTPSIPQNKVYKVHEYIKMAKANRINQQQQQTNQHHQNINGWNVVNQNPQAQYQGHQNQQFQMNRGMTYPNNQFQQQNFYGNNNFSVAHLNQDASTINSFQNAMNKVQKHPQKNQKLSSFLGDQGFSMNGTGGVQNNVSKSAFGQNLSLGNAGNFGEFLFFGICID